MTLVSIRLQSLSAVLVGKKVGKKVGKLNQLKISALVAKSKPYRVADGDGLNVLVSVAGGLSWQGRYKVDGREQIVTLGRYPVVSLKRARELWLKVRVDRSMGFDPVVERRKVRAEIKSVLAKQITFGAAWQEWVALRRQRWGDSRFDGVSGRFRKYLAGSVGDLPISSERVSIELLSVLHKACEAGNVTAAWVLLGDCGSFAKYCIAAKYISQSFTVGLSQLIPEKGAATNHPAIVVPEHVHKLMRDIYDYQDDQNGVIRLALLLSALVFVRPQELRDARWSDINIEAKEWRLSTKTRKKEEQILVVPLSSQAMGILEEILSKGRVGNYVFMQHNKNAQLTHDLMIKPLKKMGYEKTHSLHGFRATARTVLDEVLRQDTRIIEMQLGHVVRDSNGTAYNRTKFLEDRRQMMQLWADWLYQSIGGK